MNSQGTEILEDTKLSGDALRVSLHWKVSNIYVLVRSSKMDCFLPIKVLARIKWFGNSRE